MTTSGLSTDQAPPFWAPMRFFVTAPFMGLVAALLMIAYPDRFASIQDPIVIATIHLVTLGMITMVMLGAFQQMLPVLAAAKISYPLHVAQITHLALAVGTLSFASGFWMESPLFLHGAAILLILAFSTILIAISWPLVKKARSSSTVNGMRLSLFFGTIAVLLGLFLLNSYAGSHFSDLHTHIARWHILTAVFGFAVMLLIGVAIQVLPMFYVTPSIPKFCRQLPFALITLSLLLFPLSDRFLWGVMAGLFAFAFCSQKSLLYRKRPVADTTIRYWQLSGSSLTLGIIYWSVIQFLDADHSSFNLALIFGGGFLLSAIQGMLYKIVPFLIWFHLTSMGYLEVPHMRALISENKMKTQFYFFAAAGIFLFGGGIDSIYIAIGGVFFLFSNALLFYNLVSAVLIYQKTLKTERFNFEMPPAEA